MRKLFQGLLGFLAQRTVRRFKPTVVAVTGSVGKTSTKEAIAAVLARAGTVRKNSGNLNNEIGVPLTIFGKQGSAGVNPFFWLGVFFGAVWKLIRGGAYPKYLVLEMAADHPGDIHYLTWIAPPRIGVVTAVSPVHMQFYSSIGDVAKEKFGVIKPLTAEGFALLNADDEVVRNFASQTKAKVITFGKNEDATVRLSIATPAYGPPLPSNTRKAVLGVNVGLVHMNDAAEIFVQGVIGEGIAASLLAAAAVGHVVGVSLPQAAAALTGLRFPPGRMRLLEGMDDILLVDDTYNSSPRAVHAALQAVAALDPSMDRPVRRYAVLGHMAELGITAEQLHEETGRMVAEAAFDGLIVLGEHAHAVARGAEAGGMTQERLFIAKHHEQAIAHLHTLLEPGDIVLVKGSQAARMEAVVAALLKDPALAGELLVRQGAAWQKSKPVIRLNITTSS
ncbi:MAG: UDP-N-acetylmuramoyl-tripeptide--D-alanyl-D-alanine ligase [Patescibacteria group bacterium]|jgi:UDP-N-acetylmuramoyl-tripeptide--D-alanyl-D-alanine ligase